MRRGEVGEETAQVVERPGGPDLRDPLLVLGAVEPAVGEVLRERLRGVLALGVADPDLRGFGAGLGLAHGTDRTPGRAAGGGNRLGVGSRERRVRSDRAQPRGAPPDDRENSVTVGISRAARRAVGPGPRLGPCASVSSFPRAGGTTSSASTPPSSGR
ncbi:hypothetical protein GCM10010472_46040 [Pseudonocardia halophobica]|uniref:Uncharacterized protein n=1 Tax=Pseudonocardia halophobica TaxID=29401 RepID=A0A9W6L841_9PSEU|nr:hypothetical protein GCM10017577_50840 [Pseudonocardia halophobica]